MRLSNDSAETMTKLEALSLVFRVLARHGRRDEGEAAFRRFYLLLRSTTSSRKTAMLLVSLRRLELDQLVREYELLQKRNKAGVSTSLVA